MIVVTGRDYRANLAKYYGLAQKGEDVVVKANTVVFGVGARDIKPMLFCQRGFFLEAKVEYQDFIVRKLPGKSFAVVAEKREEPVQR